MWAYLLLVINIFVVMVNTAVNSLFIFMVAMVKLCLPTRRLKVLATRAADQSMWVWATINMKILSLSNRVEWDIEGLDELKQQGWYLLISNHISWTDIVVLCSVFKDRIPMPKFFLKQQLLYVPFIGIACWALDMPFMRRYSRAYLLKHPEKRGQDLATTRRSCKKFQHHPTTVVNYVEGTRFTLQKHQQSRAAYEHLLMPKTGGIAYTLAAMGEQFENIIDVTLAYPENRHTPFKDLLMGKMTRVVVRVRLLPIDENVNGDYFNDKRFKRDFQQWLSQVWQEKDELLKRIHQS